MLHEGSQRKVARERDLFKKNYINACEGLLFLKANKRHHQETVILPLKKSILAFPELLAQFSSGIAGVGLVVMYPIFRNLASLNLSYALSRPKTT